MTRPEVAAVTAVYIRLKPEVNECCDSSAFRELLYSTAVGVKLANPKSSSRASALGPPLQPTLLQI
ncbi:hypothetical protein J6590_104815 [Homalodisca vitripennis]|nr:hypothetical protein J6590_104815 [Homalodisca vitripennis]